MKAFFLTLACLPILGCQMQQPINTAAWLDFSVHGFSIKYPPRAQYHFDRPDGSVAFATSNGKDESGDYYISIKDSEMIESIPSLCSPTFTGASQMTHIPDTGGQTSWGKFDYEFSPDPKIGEGEFYCVPFASTPHVYVMCSEKDEKTVLICVSQVTDNPELAKQIFETFRWTE